MKKHRNHTFAHSWQRVRTTPPADSPLYAQETMPISVLDSATSLPEAQVPPPSTIVDEGPKTGPHRRLGPVRLRKMTKPGAVVPQALEEPQVLPTDIEDMSFLNDPQLQNMLRHYRQKSQKKE